MGPNVTLLDQLPPKCRLYDRVTTSALQLLVPYDARLDGVMKVFFVSDGVFFFLHAFFCMYSCYFEDGAYVLAIQLAYGMHGVADSKCSTEKLMWRQWLSLYVSRLSFCCPTYSYCSVVFYKNRGRVAVKVVTRLSDRLEHSLNLHLVCMPAAWLWRRSSPVKSCPPLLPP